jgi:hypothetical protein
MKARFKYFFPVTLFIFFLALCPLLAHAQGDPQELRKQACEKTFEIIAQCQQTAAASGSSCEEVAGIISSPQTKGSLSQSRPAGATDTLISETVTLVSGMCKAACQRAKNGILYKNAQDWINSGGCTIEVTR